MVVKIPKNLEMKSLLPAPCSPLPAHVLAFSGAGWDAGRGPDRVARRGWPDGVARRGWPDGGGQTEGQTGWPDGGGQTGCSTGPDGCHVIGHVIF
jgi:hypothetical protein